MIEQGLEQPGEINATVRLGALAIVGVCWLWAILTLGLLHDLDAAGAAGRARSRRRSPTSPTHVGPWIIVATVFVPLFIAAERQLAEGARRGRPARGAPARVAAAAR